MTKYSKQPLGRMTSVDVREAWEREDTGFTRWLAEEQNLSLLGEALGIELQLETVEHNVGSFRADIRCRQVGTDRVVIIENQLERTDHSHLGQLLTYAAGERLVTVVWISPQFRDEHRAAVDWLNEVTSDAAEFFGIEIELWKIGDSLPAPRFHLVAKPNDFTRTTLDPTDTGYFTERQGAQLAFWTQFTDLCKARGGPIRPQKPRGENWMPFAIGATGTYLYASMRLGRNTWRVGWVANGPSRELLNAFMEADKVAIESQLGESLEWHATSSGKEFQIRSNRAADGLADPLNWPRVQSEMLDLLEKYYHTFTTRISTFKTSHSDRVDAENGCSL